MLNLLLFILYYDFFLNIFFHQVEREIPLEEWTEEGHQFYVSLMRGSLQVRQGDTVYVLRDIPIDAARPDVSAGAGAEPGGAKQDSPKTKRPDRKLKNIAKGKSEETGANKVGLYILQIHK